MVAGFWVPTVLQTVLVPWSAGVDWSVPVVPFQPMVTLLAPELMVSVVPRVLTTVMVAVSELVAPARAMIRALYCVPLSLSCSVEVV